MSALQTVAVDFDGVIYRYSKGWHDGTIYDPPADGALEALHTLMTEYAVYVLTCRNGRAVADWLADYGFNAESDGYDPLAYWGYQGRLLVTNRKLPAIAYIDDRAIRFTTWPLALGQLAEVAR